MNYEVPDETTPSRAPELRPSGQGCRIASWNRHPDDDDEPAFWLELAQERLLPVLTRCAA